MPNSSSRDNQDGAHFIIRSGSQGLIARTAEELAAYIARLQGYPRELARIFDSI